MKRRARFAVLCAVLAVAVGLAVVFVARNDSDAASGISLLRAEDRLPNRTATDWVTYADHVVVVTPTEAKDQVRARGAEFVDRDLTLRVDEVLWSRPKAPRPAPEVFGWRALGWSFEGGDTGERTELAMESAPRVETGHSYVMAVVWEEARCSEGDPSIPAQWGGLGSSGVIPFDDAILGQGESEGRVVTVAQAREKVDSPTSASGLEGRLAGKGATALVAELRSATPAERRTFLPAAPCK
ncbi:hypothetical protein [Streptomyces gardneri]|uniref:hypothetical protein n=1 Tax=Streptomyces gardneri TaxID=66892 RepID=UPI0033EF33BE